MTEMFRKNTHEFPPKNSCGSGYTGLAKGNLRTLKEDVADGSYEVSPGRIAEKIVSTQLFLFTSCC